MAQQQDGGQPADGVGEIAKYRTHVGMRGGYDLMGGVQFALLMNLGMRETSTICDVGCGSLRVGRLLIPFLLTGGYCGIEPERWKIEEGIEHEVERLPEPLDVDHVDADADDHSAPLTRP